ncbi:aldose 1-epimerase [Clostridium sp. DSM 8431]|uniref:aldose epimerase family protein n=1 Tax=Clostridium sp. DSM 8431 TaxID=1761781 RepID=UPI0008DF9906|nr:aldose epimerase family protein [Clostridium sp. DSM 8431]SFU51392.1 aldose 1-epimerase [Clostridium sp. DSM 8431]
MKIFRKKVLEKDNENIYQYILINDNDIEIKILTLGGIITDIMVPDKYGRKENVVVKWKELKDYFDDDAYTGSIIGRTAGRIADGKAEINGEEYDFNINNAGVNQLHGGKVGFNKKIWSDKHLESKNNVSLILEYRSIDGEEGYPGNLDVKVIYSLNNNNEFSIEYSAVSNRDTLVNMTNHAYFNLSGNMKSNILDHTLKIKASNVAEIREDGAPNGNIFNVENTPFDFREEKTIKKDLWEDNNQLDRGNGYDHPWILDEHNNCIKLEDEKSGRIMEVSTDSKATVIYTTNYPSNKILFNGNHLMEQGAICIETQNLPIGENNKFVEDSILLKDTEFKRKTIFKFSVTR